MRTYLAIAAALLIIALPATAAVEWRAPVQLESGPATPAAPAPVAKPGTANPRTPFFNVANVQARLTVYQPDYQGNLSRASSLHREFVEENVQIRTAKSWHDYLWTTSASVRRSGDPLVQSNHVHDWRTLSLVTSLAYKQKWDLTFGNVLPSYHRYAVSASMEGLLGNWRGTLPRGYRVEASAAAGRTARYLTNRRYTRWLEAANLLLSTPQTEPGQAWWGPVEFLSLRGSGSYTHDDPGSIDLLPGNAVARIDARAYAARLESRIRGGYSLDADYGFSTGQTDVRSATRIQSGSAWAANLNYQRPDDLPDLEGWRRIFPVSWRGSAEWVADDYYAPQASAGANQKRWAWNASHLFTDWAQFQWNLNRSADNARHKVVNTNYTFAQGYNLALLPFQAPLMQRVFGMESDSPSRVYELLELDNFKLTFDFRHTGRYATNFTSNAKTEDYSAGLGHQVAGWSIGGQFAWQLTDNDIAAATDRRTERWSLTLGRSFEFEKLGLTLQANGGWNEGYDALRIHTQVTRTENVNASLSALWRGVSAGANWSRARINRHPTLSWSRTHNASANIGYQPKWIPGLSLRATGTLMDINEQIRTQDFRQREWRCEATYDF